jgi:hypothetical protein
MPQVSDADLIEQLAIARRELSEALERQVATDDVLRVIASSSGDLHTVFDAILSNANRLCEASFGVLWNYDGERFHAAALHNVPQPFAEFVQKPMKPVPGGTFMRLITGEAVVQIVDGANYKLYRSGASHLSRGFVDLGRAQTLLFVALRKDGVLREASRSSAGRFGRLDRASSEFRRAGGHRHREYAAAQ